MAKFSKGASGNPRGRPKAAKGLRAALDEKYGADGKQLVAMLGGFLTSENEKIRLDAWKVGMAYRFGQPTQRHEHIEEQPRVPSAVTFVINEQPDSKCRT